MTSIEDTWMTDWWECQVFAFVLAISEVHEFLILRYFVYCGLHWEGVPTLQDCLRKFLCQIINNIYIGERGGGVSFFQNSFFG